MANMQSFCFSIAFYNFATLENQLTYQCPSSWPVIITMKKKSASTSKKMSDIGWSKFMATSLQPVESILKETGRSCDEGADFSWLSSKVSRTLIQDPPTYTSPCPSFSIGARLESM
jgi:hypothetical protein